MQEREENSARDGKNARENAERGREYWKRNENLKKEGQPMSRTFFLKGMGTGLAVGACLSLCFLPRRHKMSRRISRVLKLAGSALDRLGGTMGF